MYKIGPFNISSYTVLAPMAGVTDSGFRKISRQFGAGLATTEMLTSQQSLWTSQKSSCRLDLTRDIEPRSVQIAGSEPALMASAAQEAVCRGAQIIDINMGCPAKKVCRKAAGSSLLRDEKLVEKILEAVVFAVDVPVTLKIRTGWNKENRNALTIARIAEDKGVQALAIHGRTRACGYESPAEYDTIASVVSAVDIPIIANGDIDSPSKAQEVLNYTGAAAVMLGRSVLGCPWLFRSIDHFLKTGGRIAEPSADVVISTIALHLQEIYQLYGESAGVKIARKHVGWYIDALHKGGSLLADTALQSKQQFYQVHSRANQQTVVNQLYSSLVKRVV